VLHEPNGAKPSAKGLARTLTVTLLLMTANLFWQCTLVLTEYISFVLKALTWYATLAE